MSSSNDVYWKAIKSTKSKPKSPITSLKINSWMNVQLFCWQQISSNHTHPSLYILQIYKEHLFKFRDNEVDNMQLTFVSVSIKSFQLQISILEIIMISQDTRVKKNQYTFSDRIVFVIWTQQQWSNKWTEYFEE